MKRIEGWAGRLARLVLLGGVLLIGPGVSAVHATASPVGACCLASGQCLSVTQFDCEGQAGTFFGDDTSCVMIECPTLSVGVPLLSIFGVVAAIGALMGLGVYRLVLRRGT